jgi:5'-nucleotidase
MSEAGYEIGAFGNHEFDYGPRHLADALAYRTFDHVCTDLAVEGTPLEGTCVPWLIEDYDGLRVGFFSMMTESLPYIASPGEVTLKGTNLETAGRAVSELRDAGAQVVVCVSHTGLDNDLEVARSVEGIDIIYGGHSHAYTLEGRRVGDAVVVNAGTKGPFLVRIDLSTNAEGRVDHAGVSQTLIPVVPPIEPARDIEATLDSFRKELPAATVLGRTDVEWDLAKEAVRGGESSVANMINDAMREKFPVDIVLNNSGAFRGRALYKPGPVTDVMLQEIDEFGNEAIMFDLEGRYLRPVLERSAASFGGGGFLQISGLRCTLDLTRQAQELSRSEDGEWSIAVEGERVIGAEVLGEGGTWAQIDLDGTYRILSNGFLVDYAGDGYYWFGSYGSAFENTHSTFASIMTEIIANEGALNPTEPDGRITILR